MHRKIYAVSAVMRRLDLVSGQEAVRRLQAVSYADQGAVCPSRHLAAN